MSLYIVRRLMQSGLVMLIMSLIVFFGVYAIGDPVELLVNPEADESERQRVIEGLGLDKPIWVQYAVFLGNALQGDLGRSFVHNEPTLQLILSRLPATLELAVFALLLSILIGIPAGLWAGLRPRAKSSRVIMTGSILGFSLPNFWQGMMLILIFAVLLGWAPAAGRGDTVDVMGMRISFLTWDGFSHIILPGLNLALYNIAVITRLTRAGTREVALQDFVKFAQAKGVRSSRIVGRHVLKNIMIPIVTVIGLEFGGLIAFSTVTEAVFGWPGMGKLLLDSINRLDRPMVVAYLVFITFFFILINLAVDVLYSVLDPRVRLDGLNK